MRPDGSIRSNETRRRKKCGWGLALKLFIGHQCFLATDAAGADHALGKRPSDESHLDSGRGARGDGRGP